MATMNVSMPADLMAYVDERVSADSYDSSSEYVRELIRKDKDVQQFRALIRDAMASPVAGAADAAYFDAVRERIRTRAAS